VASADAIDYLSHDARCRANRILACRERGFKMGEERAEESSATAGGPRKIIHIDMDAFYAWLSASCWVARRAQ
jgi:hypothetical protein